MTVLDEKSEDQSYQISSSVALVTLCQCEHGSNKQLTSKDRAEKNTGKKEKNTNMPCRRTCRSHSELLVKQRPQNSQGRRFSALGPELLVLLVGDARTSGKKKCNCCVDCYGMKVNLFVKDSVLTCRAAPLLAAASNSILLLSIVINIDTNMIHIFI